MGILNIVLTQADFSANYLKKGTPIIASEETADAIISQLKQTNETIEDSLRLFFYQLKQSGIFPKIKNLVLPCICSDLGEAQRNWINISEYEEGVSKTDYGEHKGLLFDSVNRTIYNGSSVSAARNFIVNPLKSLVVGNTTVCFCTKGHQTDYTFTQKIFISIEGSPYTALKAQEISFYQDSKNNVLPIGNPSDNINHPIIGTWHCSNNDGYMSAFTAGGQYFVRNTNPTEWTLKNTAVTSFGNIAIDTPMRFILLSEGLSKEEMVSLYDIVNTFLASL